MLIRNGTCELRGSSAFIVGGSAMLLLVLISFAFTVGGLDPRRCLLYKGICVLQCPHGMHPYNTRCDIDTVSQRTCDNPEPYKIGYTCGWSRCDCNGDLLLDETTGHCVDNVDCPDTRHVHKKPSGKARKHGPRRKKIRPTEDAMPELE